MFQITPHTRLRRSPYYEATVAEGVTAFMTYNRMLMPTSYGNPDGEYWRLMNGVSQWDVAGERQVQMVGPDAGRLAQILTPRNLANCVVGQGKYVPLCTHAGHLINDPILLKLDDDRYWLSIADSNILIWANAIAAERGLDVTVNEPDVSPLAVQGPKAEDVVAALFGDWVREMWLFRFRETDLAGIPLVLSRSGWSKQGGFELFLRDGSKGVALWNLVREAGQPFGIGPGSPNACERIENGLLSWGGDTDGRTNPYEVRLGSFVDLDVDDEVIGIQALRRIHAEGPKRHQIGLILDDPQPMPGFARWCPIERDGQRVGMMTNGVFSRRLERNIGFALISRDCRSGEGVEVMRDGALTPATLTDLPFV